MGSSDILLSISIIIVFIILFMVNILSVGIKNIEDNWPTYRCNPVVMPFAGMFGQDAASNFTYCIQTMQTNYMEILQQPITYNLDVIGNLGSSLTDSINSIRGFIDYLRNSITEIIQNVFGVFLNILVEFQRILMLIKDMVGKLSGIMVTLIYTLSGAVSTMESTWNGPPGQLVQSLQGLCFHPDTILRLADGKLTTFKEIDVEDTIKYEKGHNPPEVISVMKLSNKRKDGSFREEMFVLKGENGSDIIVSGCHLVWDKIKFISVRDYVGKYPDKGGLSNTQTDILYCLITSTHTIPIGDYIFHDWEDNNGSYSKSLER